MHHLFSCTYGGLLFLYCRPVNRSGAPEICLKDMAGIGRPEMLGQLVRNIKDKHPEVIVQYHGHSGPGLSMASILEVCENGADIIDVAMEPLSWGKSAS